MTVLELTSRPAISDRLATLPVVIVGAGPIGLAAAANLAERGIDCTPCPMSTATTAHGSSGSTPQWSGRGTRLRTR